MVPSGNDQRLCSVIDSRTEAEVREPITLAYAPVKPLARTRVWIVPAIVIGVVAAMSVQNSLTEMHSAKVARTSIVQAALGPNGTLSQAVKMYKSNVSRYPNALADLLSEPLQLQGTVRWRGPYLEDLQGLLDPWGNPYQYRAPGMRNKKGFDLWSYGPDGVAGTPDDIFGGG